MAIRHNKVGLRYGRLVVEEFVGRAPNRQALWRCACDCGGSNTVRGCNLVSGHVTSCGCAKPPPPVTEKHGHAKGGKLSSEYTIWRSMRTRCYDATHVGFPGYGGRGITVCSEWRESFEAFVADMGPRPSKGHSLDRIDNNGPYSKANCRWATMAEQSANKRTTRLVTVLGETLPLFEAMRRFAPEKSKATISARLRRGWDVERSLLT